MSFYIEKLFSTYKYIEMARKIKVVEVENMETPEAVETPN